MATDGSPAAFHHGLYFLELVCTKCHFTKKYQQLLAIDVVQSFGYTKCQLINTLSAAALDRCCGPGCEGFFLDFRTGWAVWALSSKRTGWALVFVSASRIHVPLYYH